MISIKPEKISDKVLLEFELNTIVLTLKKLFKWSESRKKI